MKNIKELPARVASHTGKNLITKQVESEKSEHSKRMGQYLIGPQIETSPVKSIITYLSRKDGTDEFYTLKVYSTMEGNLHETHDEMQGRRLILTEHKITLLLQGVKGVVCNYGLFRTVWEEQENQTAYKRAIDTTCASKLCLILGYFKPEEFNSKFKQITNMQNYVFTKKKLSEAKAMHIFLQALQIIERVHKLNIVHRDIKLGNFILDTTTGKLTLVNFNLAHHLSKDTEKISDQRGTPAYTSPEIIFGKPYLGKPTDMWSAGILLYAMLYGKLPFYHEDETEIFRKIIHGQFIIPLHANVSKQTIQLLKSLLTTDPTKRLTASQALTEVRQIIASSEQFKRTAIEKVLPECHDLLAVKHNIQNKDHAHGIPSSLSKKIIKKNLPRNMIEYLIMMHLLMRILANPKITIPGVYDADAINNAQKTGTNNTIRNDKHQKVKRNDKMERQLSDNNT